MRALLGTVIDQYQLPVHHLHELLDAFEKDVRGTAAGHRYQSYDELLGYCQLSANPVGRLMLHLYGVHDEESKTQSDAICSALQLINFWQDVSVDVPRGRFYVPPMGLSPVNARNALSDKARSMMLAGSALCKRLSKMGHWRFGFELRLVVQGGLRILDKIRHDKLVVELKVRPKLRAWDMPIIFYRALVQ
jgi:phytoene/squalene synthetase